MALQSQSAMTAKIRNTSEFGEALGPALAPAIPVHYKASPELLAPLKADLGGLSEQVKTNGELLRELQKSVQELKEKGDDRIAKRMERHGRGLNEDGPEGGGLHPPAAAAFEAALKRLFEERFVPMETLLFRMEERWNSVYRREQILLSGDASADAANVAERVAGLRESDDSKRNCPIFTKPCGCKVDKCKCQVDKAGERSGGRQNESTHCPDPATKPVTKVPHWNRDTDESDHSPADSQVPVSSESNHKELRKLKKQRKKMLSAPRGRTRHSWQGTWMVVLHEDVKHQEAECESKRRELGLKEKTWREKTYNTIGRFLSWLLELREPERKGYLADIVKSNKFEGVIAVVLVLNAMFITLATNHEMEHLQVNSVGFFEFIFSVIYAAELVLRLKVHKWYFFVGPECWWNGFDFGLVALSFYDVIYSLLLRLADRGSGVLVQSLRILRIVRVLRLFRLVQVFAETRMLFNCVTDSLLSLFSSCMLLCLVFFLFALLFVQTLSIYLMDHGASDPTAEPEIGSLFGSVQLAMFTLYRSVFHGDDWDEYYQVLHGRSDFSSGLFIFFVGFLQLCVFNVLGAIFFERAQHMNKPDQIVQMITESMTQIELADELRALIDELDTNGDGTIDADEMQGHLADDLVWAKFLHLGIDLRSSNDIFEVLERSLGSSKDIPIEKFVEGCMKMRGPASSLFQQALLVETKKLRDTQVGHIHAEKILLNDLVKRLDEVAKRQEEMAAARAPYWADGESQAEDGGIFGRSPSSNRRTIGAFGMTPTGRRSSHFGI